MADEKELPSYVRHWADLYEKFHGETPTIYRRGSWWTLNRVKCQKRKIWSMASHLEWQIRQMEWKKLCRGGPQ